MINHHHNSHTPGTPLAIRFRAGALILFAVAAWWTPPIAYASEPPEMDPSKPLYQKRWGGKVIAWPVGSVHQVRVPDPQTAAELRQQLKMQDMRHKQVIAERERERQLSDYNFGSWMKRLGWALLAIGFAAHFATSFGPVKSAASTIGWLGAASVVGGVGLQKTVQYDIILTGILCIVGVAVCWKYRHQSLSHLPWIQKLKGKSK